MQSIGSLMDFLLNIAIVFIVSSLFIVGNLSCSINAKAIQLWFPYVFCEYKFGVIGLSMLFIFVLVFGIFIASFSVISVLSLVISLWVVSCAILY